MQTFESGGVLAVNPRANLRAAMAALGVSAVALVVPPLLGLYLLVVA